MPDHIVQFDKAICGDIHHAMHWAAIALVIEADKFVFERHVCLPSHATRRPMPSSANSLAMRSSI